MLRSATAPGALRNVSVVPEGFQPQDKDTVEKRIGPGELFDVIVVLNPGGKVRIPK
jgi:hypothetical protein